MSDVRVLNILGRNYSIRVTDGEEDTLARAAKLLQERVNESQLRFSQASSQEVLVMAALNLCVPLIQQEQRLEAVEVRLGDTLTRIRQQLDAAPELT